MRHPILFRPLLVQLMAFSLVLICARLVSACDSSCEEERPDLCGVSLLGRDSASYEERDEAGNNDGTMAEDTEYSLDRAGLEVLGSLETSTPSADAYLFHVAATEDGSDVGLDAQTLIEGRVMGIGDALTLQLLSVGDSDFGVLTATSFEDAQLSADRSYVLVVTPTRNMEQATSGKTYRLELRAHPAR